MIWQRGWYWLAFPLLLLPGMSRAEEKTQPILLDAVTILGTRTERPSDEIPRSVEVISDERIAHQQSGSLGEALTILPNVSLTGSPRPIGEDIQIRGLSGERILLLLDGARQVFTKGHLSRAFIEPDMIDRIAVERGPASVLWGSGALGGVVSVETKDAVDLLAPDESFGARFRGSYQSVNDGWFGSAAIYGTPTAYLDFLVYVSRRDNDNLELGNGTTLAHSAYQRDSLLAKATFYPTAYQSIGLYHRHLWLNGESLSNPTALPTSNNPVVDRQVTLSSSHLEWQLTPESPLVDLHALFYHTETEVNAFARGLDRHDYSVVDTLGFNVTNTSRFDLGVAGRHALTYGIDGYRNSAEGTRNGHPRPMFPNAIQRVVGVFIQDEIHWNNWGWGHWITTLGLRYDHYHSESETHVAPAQDEGSLSMQFGLLWQTTDWLTLYASYAEAFRAPSLTELYAIGIHFGANRFVPNPDLKPELAANKEIGLRTEWSDLFTAGDRLKMELTYFRNDVENFIDLYVQVEPLPYPPFVGGTTRSKNVTEAHLTGIEASVLYTTDSWFAALSYGQTRGYNETKDQPLASVAPDKWVFRAGLTTLPWNGRITWRATVVENQDRVPPGVPETPGYTVYDIFTSWYPTPHLRLDFAITNITDKSYRRHNAVIKEAGRNFKVSLTWKF